MRDYFQLPESEFSFQFARSSGAGGQNVNKVNSKAILIWDATRSTFFNESTRARFLERFANRIREDGCFILQSERFRDQPRNIDDCKEKLREMIAEIWFPPKVRRKTKPSKSSQRKRLDGKKIHGEKKRARRTRDW